MATGAHCHTTLAADDGHRVARRTAPVARMGERMAYPVGTDVCMLATGVVWWSVLTERRARGMMEHTITHTTHEE